MGDCSTMLGISHIVSNETIHQLLPIAGLSSDTVNREYFVVKIFSDSLACAKMQRTKIHAQY